jgi:hypothetical protein
MNYPNPSLPATRARGPHAHSYMKRTLAKACALLLLLACAFVSARAQTAKLPTPDRIVSDYVKAVGGGKRLASLRDASYEWSVLKGGAEAGTARTRVKTTGALRSDLILSGGESDSAANARTAWARASDGRLRTLTDSEALTARLRATLEGAWFADYKKQKVLARTVAREAAGGEQAYAVEFTTRAGARLRYWFGATSKVLLQMSDETRRMRVRFADWRARAGSPLLSEPHRVELENEGEPVLTLTLRESSYNTGLADSLFEPPSDSTLDIPGLLRDLTKNQDEDDKRINDYTFTQKVTEREMDDKGRATKEKVSVYEVFPIAGYGWVEKLVSENGVALSPERAEKEAKRAGEELEKAEREAPKLKAKRERQRAERKAKRDAKSGDKSASNDDEDEDVGVATFLRASEFISPRRERFRDRDVIVFDFRPRAGFRPSDGGEALASKLSGVMWVDPVERRVMRLEARLVDNYKMGGGLLVSIKPGSAVVFETTRLPEGVWMPRFAQVNASARLFLFKGMKVNMTREFSDFKRFSSKSGEDKLDSPKEKPEEKP